MFVSCILPRPPTLPHSTTRLPRLPPLPEVHSKHYYFLGWHVTAKWLTSLALNNNFPSVFAYHTSFDGIRYVSQKSGYKFAYPAAGLVNREISKGKFLGEAKISL